MTAFERMNPCEIRIQTETGWATMKKIAGGWEYTDAIGNAMLSFIDDSVFLTATALPIKTLSFRWPASFQNGAMLLGDAWERGYGNLTWQGIIPERCMPWYFLVDECGMQSAIGVKTGAGAICSWFADTNGITLIADTSVGCQGVLLKERTLSVCTIVSEHNVESDSFSFACAFMKKMCDAPKLANHTVYGGNNWYYAYGNSSHAKILEDSRFISEMASGIKNRPYMVIDDGWQLASGNGGCNGGPWIGNRLFPKMQELAEEMVQAGVRPGIWMRPLLTSEYIPTQMQRCMASNGRLLDPTHPGTHEYVAEGVSRLANWGYQLIKHDFTTFDVFGSWGYQVKGHAMNFMKQPFFDRSHTMAEVITNLYRTISDARGSSILIGCNTIGHLGAGIFELQRTGDDTSGRTWERTRYMGINTLAMRMPQNRTFFDCDADCVGITNEVPWGLNKQWLDLLARSGTPLFVSADPLLMDNVHKEAIQKAFVIASQPIPAGIPLDWKNTSAPTEWLFGNEKQTYDWYQPVESYPRDVWWR